MSLPPLRTPDDMRCERGFSAFAMVSGASMIVGGALSAASWYLIVPGIVFAGIGALSCATTPRPACCLRGRAVPIIPHAPPARAPRAAVVVAPSATAPPPSHGRLASPYTSNGTLSSAAVSSSPAGAAQLAIPIPQ